MTPLTAPASIPAPATPRPLQTASWILDPTGYMRTNRRRFGDLFRVALTPGESSRTLMVSEPKALQQMLSSDSGRSFSAPGDVNELLVTLLGRQSVILLSGQAHRQRRQLVMPHFHGEILAGYERAMETITQEELGSWPAGDVRSVRSVMQTITLRIILQVVFGLERGERAVALRHLLSRRLEMTATPLTSAVFFLPWLQRDFGPWSLGARINRLAEATDALLFEEIRERRNGPCGGSDMLSLLLQARDEQGQGLTDQELRDELITLLVAGHETTATALTTAFYWLHRPDRPEPLQTLREELDGLEPGAGADALVRLPYLGAVTQEALRIHPVAMLTFPRRVEVPLECCGYRLEPGDLVMGSIYLLHQREDLYPQPECFRPERFLERQYSPYEYMPFGGGVRRCIGTGLARHELRVVLGTLMRQDRFRLCNRRPVPQARRGVTLGHGAPVLLRRERPS